MAEHGSPAIQAAEAVAEARHVEQATLPPLGEKPHVGDPAPALHRADADLQPGGASGSETEDDTDLQHGGQAAAAAASTQSGAADGQTQGAAGTADGAAAQREPPQQTPAAIAAAAMAPSLHKPTPSATTPSTASVGGGAAVAAASTTPAVSTGGGGGAGAAGGRFSGSGGAAAPRRPAASRAGVVSLRLLVEEGLLQPGKDVLSVDYKGRTQLGSLTEEGRITATVGGQDLTFESPSAFSIFIKRLVNPTRKADDGWKTVRYGGKTLDHYKMELVRKRVGMPPSSLPEPLPKKPKLGGNPSSSTLSSLSKGGAPSSSPSRPPPPASPQVTGAEVVPGSNRLKLKLSRPKPPPPPDMSDDGSFHSNGLAAGDGAGSGRPRRQVRAPSRFAALGVDDEHALQPLEAYGPGVPGTKGAQPFVVQVAPAAELMMDCHAHLCANEVIGVLAGSWDAASSTITVRRAFPVLELATEDDSVNVEMDPVDELRVREEIEGKHGMRVVGWYHSHPTFPTHPSLIDIYNQVLQQHHHREGGQEPYIAAIVGPYDRRLPSPSSAISWFYVEHPPGKIPDQGQNPSEAGCTAKALQTQPLYSDDPKVVSELSALPKGDMQQLARRYAAVPQGVDIEGKWREGMTRVEKLAESLKGRLPPSFPPKAAREFTDKILYSIPAVWAVFGSGLQRREPSPSVPPPPSPPAPASAKAGEGGEAGAEGEGRGGAGEAHGAELEGGEAGEGGEGGAVAQSDGAQEDGSMKGGREDGGGGDGAGRAHAAADTPPHAPDAAAEREGPPPPGGPECDAPSHGGGDGEVAEGPQ